MPLLVARIGISLSHFQTDGEASADCRPCDSDRSNVREQRPRNEWVGLSFTGAGKRKRLQMEMRVAPLPFLDWPIDLFARANAAVRATPPTSIRRRRIEKNCTCGCNQKHNLAVSAVEEEDGQRRVLWFRTIACRNRHMGTDPRVA
jgi:hypothetical protein